MVLETSISQHSTAPVAGVDYGDLATGNAARAALAFLEAWEEQAELQLRFDRPLVAVYGCPSVFAWCRRLPYALTIVMPAFNEEGNIERAVRSALEVGRDLAPPCEVVVVDDGSHDGTGEILGGLERELADELGVVRLGDNRGYGAALRAGFAAARGTLVFYTDSDNQFDLRELDGFLELIERNDAVFGFRIDRQDPALRRFVSGVFNGLSSLVLGMSVRDLNCSFKLFRREVLAGLELVSNDFLIDTELVARVHRGGWRYVQKGVRHYPRTSGRSTVRPGDVPHTLASLARLHLELRAAHLPSTRALDPKPPAQRRGD